MILPLSHDLAAELPALVARLYQEGFEVFRVMYNLAEWPDTPRRVSVEGRTVRLGGFRYQPHDLLTFIDGSGRGRLFLTGGTGMSHAIEPASSRTRGTSRVREWRYRTPTAQVITTMACLAVALIVTTGPAWYLISSLAGEGPPHSTPGQMVVPPF